MPIKRKKSRKRAVRRPSRSGRRIIKFDYNTLFWGVPVVALLGFVTAVWHFSHSSEHHPIGITSARLGNLFDKANQLPSAGEKVAFWSEAILADQNLLAPLGEGPAINDTAPVFPRHFDCTTFVETVGGLAHSTSVEELADRIISLRYERGQVGYVTRNHFPEADWIPNNVSSGNLTDITLRVARDSELVASFANKDIDKAAWFEAQGRSVASETVPIAVSLPYIPLEQFEKAAVNVPSGSIVNIVRADSPIHPVLISHQTILVRENGEPYFIHVSRGTHVARVKVSDYVASLQGQRWPVVGFNVNML